MSRNDELELLEEWNKLEREKLREEARSDILAFTRYTKDDYIVNWHHQLLCDKLNKFVNGEIKRMMVFLPPQTGKSELTSRRLPSYMLGINPDLRIALCAYNAPYASKFNRQIQRIIIDSSYKEVFPDTQLNVKNIATDSKGNYLRNAHEFEIVGRNGSFISVGIGGGITGNPVDIALIDDPIKGAEEAGSITYREKIWEWYTTELETRLNNNSQVLITLTRWNIDDLAGRVIANSDSEHSSKWEVVIFPAIKVDNSNPDDPRKIGEALWPEMHSLDKILESKHRNPIKFEALQQQNPKIMESGLEFYKAFRYDKHVRDTIYSSSIPIHVILDENVNPYITAILFQGAGKRVWQIDELCMSHPYNTVKSLASELIKRYPNHDRGMFIYGDATSQKEDTKLEKGQNFFTLFSGYIRQYNPSMRVPRSNPSVAMRGAWINTILEGNDIEIIIGTNCHNTIKDLQFIKEDADGTKFKKKVKDIRAGVSYEELGHCFIAGTKVLTNEGYINIESINKGDYVLTRKGYKKVLWSGITRNNAIVKTYKIGNNKITCTPDHEIYTYNKGFTPAYSLTRKNIFCIFDEKIKIWKKKKYLTMDLTSTGIHKQRIVQIKDIIGGALKLIINGIKNIYIDIFGSAKKGLFLKNIIFIIKMVIFSIIALIILNAYIAVNIYQIIINHYLKNKKIDIKKYFRKKPDLKQQNGMDQMKEENGIKNTLRNLFSELKKMLYVKNVKKNLNQILEMRLNTAQENAKTDSMQGKIGYLGNGMRIGIALYAENLSKFIDGLKYSRVQENVEQYSEKRENVYDITVEDEHEFFANNILVHNCSDCIDYFLTQYFQREFLLYQKGGRETKIVVGRKIAAMRY